MKKQIQRLASENMEHDINKFFGVEGSYAENKENTTLGLGQAITTGVGLYTAGKLVNKKYEKPKEKVSGIFISDNSEKKQRQMANEPVVLKDKNELDFNL